MVRLVLLLWFAVGAVAHAQSSASYAVTFDATWSETTHPEGFPHFSRLVGATHASIVTLWTPPAR